GRGIVRAAGGEVDGTRHRADLRMVGPDDDEVPLATGLAVGERGVTVRRYHRFPAGAAAGAIETPTAPGLCRTSNRVSRRSLTRSMTSREMLSRVSPKGRFTRLGAAVIGPVTTPVMRMSSVGRSGWLVWTTSVSDSKPIGIPGLISTPRR